MKSTDPVSQASVSLAASNPEVPQVPLSQKLTEAVFEEFQDEISLSKLQDEILSSVRSGEPNENALEYFGPPPPYGFFLPSDLEEESSRTRREKALLDMFARAAQSVLQHKIASLEKIGKRLQVHLQETDQQLRLKTEECQAKDSEIDLVQTQMLLLKEEYGKGSVSEKSATEVLYDRLRQDFGLRISELEKLNNHYKAENTTLKEQVSLLHARSQNLSKREKELLKTLLNNRGSNLSLKSGLSDLKYSFDKMRERLKFLQYMFSSGIQLLSDYITNVMSCKPSTPADTGFQTVERSCEIALQMWQSSIQSLFNNVQKAGALGDIHNPLAMFNITSTKTGASSVSSSLPPSAGGSQLATPNRKQALKKKVSKEDADDDDRDRTISSKQSEYPYQLIEGSFASLKFEPLADGGLEAVRANALRFASLPGTPMTVFSRPLTGTVPITKNTGTQSDDYGTGSDRADSLKKAPLVTGDTGTQTAITLTEEKLRDDELADYRRRNPRRTGVFNSTANEFFQFNMSMMGLSVPKSEEYFWKPHTRGMPYQSKSRYTFDPQPKILDHVGYARQALAGQLSQYVHAMNDAFQKLPFAEDVNSSPKSPTRQRTESPTLAASSSPHPSSPTRSPPARKGHSRGRRGPPEELSANNADRLLPLFSGGAAEYEAFVSTMMEEEKTADQSDSLPRLAPKGAERPIHSRLSNHNSKPPFELRKDYPTLIKAAAETRMDIDSERARELQADQSRTAILDFCSRVRQMLDLSNDITERKSQSRTRTPTPSGSLRAETRYLKAVKLSDGVANTLQNVQSKPLENPEDRKTSVSAALESMFQYIRWSLACAHATSSRPETRQSSPTNSIRSIQSAKVLIAKAAEVKVLQNGDGALGVPTPEKAPPPQLPSVAAKKKESKRNSLFKTGKLADPNAPLHVARDTSLRTDIHHDVAGATLHGKAFRAERPDSPIRPTSTDFPSRPESRDSIAHWNYGSEGASLILANSDLSDLGRDRATPSPH